MRTNIFINTVFFLLIILIFASCYNLNPPPDISGVIGNIPIINSDISPENNTTVYEEEVDLEWYVSDEDGDIESVDLYFGKSSDPSLQVMNINYNNYYVTDLEPNVTYYWKIVVKDKYNEVESPIWSFKTTYIGRELYGGIVCYVDETGEHGLVCTKDYLKYGYSSTFDWGETNQNYNAYGDGLGEGIQNTQNIVNLYGGVNMTAAQLCYDLDLNMYSDWYLPSLTELNYIFENLEENNISNGLYGDFWSSTEESLNYAKGKDLNDGSIDIVYKTNNLKVTAVRQF